MNSEFAPEPEAPEYYEGMKDRKAIREQQRLEEAQDAQEEAYYPLDHG